MLKIIGIEVIAALAALIAFEVICIRDKLVVYRLCIRDKLVVRRRNKFMSFDEEMAKSMEEVIKNAAKRRSKK